MTVNELIAQLKELPGEYRVLIQKDPEGNGYNWGRGATIVIPEDPEEHRPSYVYDIDSSASDNLLEEDDWEDIKKNSEKVVVIFP